MDRRTLLSAGAAVGTAAPLAVRRRGAAAAGILVPEQAGHRVGAGDVARLWEAAEHARALDSRYGGGTVRASALANCLARTRPMLTATCTDSVRRELFAATAELTRAAGWAAVDAGEHRTARHYLARALGLARAGEDAQASSYVLSTMALQAYLLHRPRQGAAMAAAAHDQAGAGAAPRVLAFAKLAEARSHGRAGDARAADAALSTAVRHLERVTPDHDPAWLAYLTPARLAADAIEINCDLHRPALALRWVESAEAMRQDEFTRAVGLRTAVQTKTHLQARDLDTALATGHRALDILTRVRSARAHTYITDIITALAPWHTEATVTDFIHRARTALP